MVPAFGRRSTGTFLVSFPRLLRSLIVALLRNPTMGIIPQRRSTVNNKIIKTERTVATNTQSSVNMQWCQRCRLTGLLSAATVGPAPDTSGGPCVDSGGRGLASCHP